MEQKLNSEQSNNPEEISVFNEDLQPMRTPTGVLVEKNDKTPNEEIRTIGVLTSGGDAPGMNAAVRSVVRTALHYGYIVAGVRRGYHGLWRGDIIPLNSRSVSDKLQRGGTFLMTARSDSFNTPEGVRKAYQMAKVFNIDALVVIGGDGTFRGARDLAHEGMKVIGIPATIDNDIGCTSYSIGFDTAMNTGMEAIDRLKDTASSHERCSVIEVMGRNAGYLALNVGTACGAEVILVPEQTINFDRDVIRVILRGRNLGKTHFVVVVAEGAGDAIEIASRIQDLTGIESRATVLGHLQRGGSPTLQDRLMASNMGTRAVECLNSGLYNQLITYQSGHIDEVDIDTGLEMKKTITREMIENAHIIAM